MPVATSIPTLFTRCRRGDADAWSDLVTEFESLVWSIPRRLGLSDDDAAEVFQQVFLALHQHLDDIEDPARLPGWLATTAHRESWRIGRKEKRARGVNLDVDAFDDDGVPKEDAVVGWERRDLVRRALAEIGPPCEPLLLALFSAPADLNYEAVADSLGMAVGSIGPTRARCLEKLERSLAALGYSPEA